MPRARYGDVHVFNNYYSSVGNNYCIRSGFNARLLVEGNFFQGVSDPMVLDGTGQVRQRENIFEFSSGTRAATGDASSRRTRTPWTPQRTSRPWSPRAPGPRVS